MDRACDHSAMRSVSHFQPFTRAKGRSWKVPPFRHRNGGPLKAFGCPVLQLWPNRSGAEPTLKPTVVTL